MILVFLDVSPSCWPVGRPGHLCQPSWPAGVQGFQDPGAGFLSATLLRLLRKWNCAVIYGPGQRGQWTPHAHPSQARPKVEVTSSGASERAWSGAFSHVSRSRAIWTLGVQSGCWEGLKARFLSSCLLRGAPSFGPGNLPGCSPMVSRRKETREFPPTGAHTCALPQARGHFLQCVGGRMGALPTTMWMVCVTHEVAA